MTVAVSSPPSPLLLSVALILQHSLHVGVDAKFVLGLPVDDVGGGGSGDDAGKVKRLRKE